MSVNHFKIKAPGAETGVLVGSQHALRERFDSSARSHVDKNSGDKPRIG